MVMRNAIRMLANRKTLGLTLLILAVAAATALAATLSGDGTLVGTNGNDNLTAGNGDDIVWGLAGSDTINAGNGNDMIDGDGQCPPEDQGKVFPSGIPGTNQCEHGHQDQNGQHDTISAGNGDDTVFGGGGRNAITVGGGDDTIYGGPIGDAITAGLGSQGNDKIYLGNGPSYTGSTVATGQGDDVIHAQNGVKDTISCQRGNGTTVYADHADSVKGCARVIYSRDPGAVPAPYSERDRATARTRGGAPVDKTRTKHRTNRKHHSSGKRRGTNTR